VRRRYEKKSETFIHHQHANYIHKLQITSTLTVTTLLFTRIMKGFSDAGYKGEGLDTDSVGGSLKKLLLSTPPMLINAVPVMCEHG